MSEVEQSQGRRRRRTFSQEFRNEAIECCQRLGVSVAAVARAYDIHPNLLRRWVTEHERSGQITASQPEAAPALPAVQVESQNAFVPVGMSQRPKQEIAESRDIRIELHHRGMTANVTWPIAASEECALWLHRLMR